MRTPVLGRPDLPSDEIACSKSRVLKFPISTADPHDWSHYETFSSSEEFEVISQSSVDSSDSMSSVSTVSHSPTETLHTQELTFEEVNGEIVNLESPVSCGPHIHNCFLSSVP